MGRQNNNTAEKKDGEDKKNKKLSLRAIETHKGQAETSGSLLAYREVEASSGRKSPTFLVVS